VVTMNFGSFIYDFSDLLIIIKNKTTMRFLKNKIALANALLASRVSDSPRGTPATTDSSQSPRSFHSDDLELAKISPTNRKRAPMLKVNSPPEKPRETKNIVKNFGKAISNFAMSEISAPYLDPILEKEGVKLQDFIAYINKTKSNIDGLFRFRALLIPLKEDTEEISAIKRVYRAIGEVFIKYFSVNWIFHGRIQYKEAHLKSRYKMLRRIQHPELFTYLTQHRH